MKRKSIGGLITLLLFFGAFLAFGIAALWITASGIYWGSQAQAWPSTQATIEVSETKRGSGRRGRRRTRLTISYRYQVAGQYFQGDQVQYLQNIFTSKSRKRSYIQMFPVGAQASLYYDPSDPQRSVLIPGYSTASAVGGGLVGTVFCLLGLWGLRHTFKPKVHLSER